MTLIYVYVKVLTFPGALTKAFFEQLMCRVFRCPVEDNRYLRTDRMCGHVEHELIKHPVRSYLFCFIPGLLNFLLAFLLAWVPLINIVFLGKYSGFVAYFTATATTLSHEPLISLIFDPLSTALNKFMTEQPFFVKTIDFITPFFFAWLSVSMLANVFPLVEDAKAMKEQYCKLSKALKVIFFPGYIVMRVGAWLEKYCITIVILVAAVFFSAVVTI